MPKKTDVDSNQEQDKKDNAEERKKGQSKNSITKKSISKKGTTKTNSKESKNSNNTKSNKEDSASNNEKSANSNENNAKKNNSVVESKELKQEKQEAKEIAATTTEKENVKLIKWDDIKNIFKKKKKLPQEALKEINKPVFYNIVVAIVIMIYFIFLILGFYNIENSVYQTDLKVFSMCILFVAIIVIEKAYKDDNGRIAIYGIETIVLAIITLGLIYVNLILSSKYVSIVLIISYIACIYYVVKSIVIYHKGKKKYFVDNVKEMINTEEE